MTPERLKLSTYSIRNAAIALYGTTCYVAVRIENGWKGWDCTSVGLAPNYVISRTPYL